MGVARRYANRGAELGDLRQVAGIGLLNAIDRYDMRRGPRFASFAVPTIAGELKRYFRDSMWGTAVPRRLKELMATCRRAGDELIQMRGRTPTPAELAAYIGVHERDVLEVMSITTAYRPDSFDVPRAGDVRETGLPSQGGDPMGVFDDIDAVRTIVASLGPLEQKILELRFSLEMTQSQIAAEVGVSQMQVSRILRKTLETLRVHLQSTA
jgi:RNA polymerase sigma-B factor